MLRLLVGSAVAVAIAASGCMPPDGPGTSPTGTPPEMTPDQGIPTVPEGGLPSMDTPPIDHPAVGQVADQARSLLAEQLEVEPSAVEVMQAEQVTWPDAAMGCPEPGQLYAQVLVEGYRVVLGHNERVWVYHAGSDGQPFLCPSDERDGGYDFVPPPGFDT